MRHLTKMECFSPKCVKVIRKWGAALQCKAPDNYNNLICNAHEYYSTLLRLSCLFFQSPVPLSTVMCFFPVAIPTGKCKVLPVPWVAVLGLCQLPPALSVLSEKGSNSKTFTEVSSGKALIGEDHNKCVFLKGRQAIL